MEPTGWVVVVVCALLGYTIVSWLYTKLPPKKPGATQNDSSQHNDQSNSKDRLNSENLFDQKIRERKYWHEILEVNESASLFEIKKAYRTKIQQYHPDRLEGMAPELYELAMKRAKDINAAYAEAERLKS